MTRRSLRRLGPRGVLPLLAALALPLPFFEACSTNEAEACPAGLQTCGDYCSLVALDPQNCGACGKACPSGRVCNDGACVVPCAFPLDQACDGECVRLNDNPQHCGSCGNACADGQQCFAGECRSL